MFLFVLISDFIASELEKIYNKYNFSSFKFIERYFI